MVDGLDINNDGDIVINTGITATSGSNTANISLNNTTSTQKNVKIIGGDNISVSSTNNEITISGTDSNPKINFADNTSNNRAAKLNLTANDGDGSSLNIEGIGSVSVDVQNGKLIISGTDDNENTTYSHKFQTVENTGEGGVEQDDDGIDHHKVDLVLNGSDNSEDKLRIKLVIL